LKSLFKFKGLLFGIFVVFFLALLALGVIELSNISRSQITVIKEVPQFKFVERSGSSFGKNDMLGKLNIVNFFFTSCQGPCPFMNSKVAELYEKYSTTDLVRFVSISVDPDRDSLTVLQRYARRFGAVDDRWLFLRGEIDRVQELTEKGFLLAGELPNFHSTKLVLVDQAGFIRGYYNCYDQDSLNLLSIHVREILRDL
jgi:protein SCO1/2